MSTYPPERTVCHLPPAYTLEARKQNAARSEDMRQSQFALSSFCGLARCVGEQTVCRGVAVPDRRVFVISSSLAGVYAGEEVICSDTAAGIRGSSCQLSPAYTLVKR